MNRSFTCPHCGASVPPGATACPECGSDSQTGWSEQAEYDDLLLYDELQAETPQPAAWNKYLTAIVAITAVSALLIYTLPWGIYLIPVVLVAAGVVYYATQVVPNQRHSQEKELYRHLMQKARGDKELVARLLEHERRRNPGADRLKWMQDVLYYWERDSR